MTSSVTFDRTQFSREFPARPFLVDHSHHSDPRLSLSAIRTLALTLPKERVEYNPGNLPVNQDPDALPDNGMGIAETLERIGEENSWMVLKNIEQVPAYRELLHESLAAMAEEVRDAVGPVSDIEGFVFVSSPGATTPFHVDPEHNFLFQIQGTKRIHIWDTQDRMVVTEAQLEAACAGAHRNLPHQPEYDARAEVFEIQPGTGLHFPVQAPHWVQNGDAVSISYSFTFRSQLSHRQRQVRFINALLRRAGVDPAAAGASPPRDRLKLATYRALQPPMALARRSARLKRLFIGR